MAHILYNLGDGAEPQDVPFEEVRLELGQKVAVHNHEMGREPLLCSVVNVPIQMLACPPELRPIADTLNLGQVQSANLSAHCKSRCFEKLPGYIDVVIYSIDNMASLLPEPWEAGVAVCLCEQPEEMQLVMLESLRSAIAEQSKRTATDSATALEDMIETFQHKDKRSEIESSAEKIRNFVSSLNRAQSTIERDVPSDAADEVVKRIDAVV